MVDIVIVNWNSGDLLRNCLNSIFINKNATIIHRVFVIDNNSKDDSCASYPPNENLTFIKNDSNEGFSRAANKGFKLCTADYVLLLNPDTLLLSNTLIGCVAYMEQNKGIDILGCQLLDQAGNITPSCARFMKPLAVFYDATGLSKIWPGIFHPATLMTDGDYTQSGKVDQVIGAFMFMPLSIFTKIGYFDERFFVYFEELDFSLRLAKYGGVSFFNAGIKAVHFGEGTTHKIKAIRLFLVLQSRLRYAYKHFSFIGFCFTFFCTCFIEPVSRFLFLLLSLRTREISDLFKGYLLLWKSFFAKKTSPVF